MLLPSPDILIPDVLFYVFSAVLLSSALAVVAARNAVHSVLFLILAFFNAAGLFVLMGAEYVAMLLLIVYVGAVAVLFLFVVMMLNVELRPKASLRPGYLWVGLLVAAVLLAELVLVFKGWVSAELARDNVLFPGRADNVGDIKTLGTLLYTHYLYPFQVAGLILLVSMIGSITLCLRLRGGIRRQNQAAQIARRPTEAMEIASVESGKGVTL